MVCHNDSRIEGIHCMHHVHGVQKTSQRIKILDALRASSILSCDKSTIFKEPIFCFIKVFTSYKSSNNF